MKYIILIISLLAPIITHNERLVLHEPVVNKQDVMLFTKIINAEARGESFRSKLYTGSVILNRLKSSKYPNSLYDVIYDKDQFHGINSRLFRFEPTEDMDSYKAAVYLLKNGSVLDSNYLFFANPKAITKPKSKIWFAKMLKASSFIIKLDNHWYIQTKP